MATRVFWHWLLEQVGACTVHVYTITSQPPSPPLLPLPLTLPSLLTGFSTSKGGMVRSILFPRKLSIKFYADAMKFVLLLAVLGEQGGVRSEG